MQADNNNKTLQIKIAATVDVEKTEDLKFHS